MYFPIYIVTLLILVPGSIYFFLHFKNLSFIKNLLGPRWISLLIAFILTVVSLYFAHFIFNLSAAIILFLFFSFIITDLINIFIKGFINRSSLVELWSKLYNTGVAAIIFTIIFILTSYYTAINVHNTFYDVKISKTLNEDYIKIAMVSDIHLGTSINLNNLEKYCSEIQKYKPDIVVLDGDIFDENTAKGSMEAACKILGNINSTYGTYYVLGNHEKGIHNNIPYFSLDDLKMNLLSNNISLLQDETKNIVGKFYIVGRKDASISHNAERKSLDTLLKNCDKNKFILLLDHQPLDFEKGSIGGVDLQLSGHTHGGQIWPTSVLSTFFKKASINYGYKKLNNFNAIISSGMGTWNYPLRLGSKSEIVFITVR